MFSCSFVVGGSSRRNGAGALPDPHRTSARWTGRLRRTIPPRPFVSQNGPEQLACRRPQSRIHPFQATTTARKLGRGDSYSTIGHVELYPQASLVPRDSADGIRDSADATGDIPRTLLTNLIAKTRVFSDQVALMAAEEPPQARWAFLQTMSGRQTGLDLSQRCVRLLPDGASSQSLCCSRAIDR